MLTQSQIVDRIHQRAQLAAQKFKVCEVELLEVLSQAERHRIFTDLGHRSLFAYATQGLGLSEEVAYIYISVARKSREVPALKAAIAQGLITVSKACRLSKVLNKENQAHWLNLAQHSSKRDLEKQIAAENPNAAAVEKLKYLSGEHLLLQLSISEETMQKLRRAQDVISQKQHRPVALAEVLKLAVSNYLLKNDPLERAEKQIARAAEKGSQSPSQGAELGPGRPRNRLPKAIRNQILLKFAGQCSSRDRIGERCQERRFLEIHHIQPQSEGVSNDLGNLELICSSHHRIRHG